MSPNKNTGRGRLVLVVDDYEDTRALAKEILRRHGFIVAEAETGEMAIEKALKLKPCLVLMDLSLPGIDGREAARRLKQSPETRDCRIIAYTALAIREFLDQAREAGCDSVLTKPCRSAELVEEITRLLGPTAR